MGNSQKYLFSDGEAVAHIENLKQKMYVESILFRFYERPVVSDPSTKEKAKQILGIKCHWWDSEGKLQSAKFHKMELVPWEIAEGSTFADIIKWKTENN